MQIDISDFIKLANRLEKIDFKDQAKYLRQTNRRFLKRQLPKVLALVESRFRSDIKVRNDRGDLTGVTLGPSTNSYILRFLIKGTKNRKTTQGHNRGKITPRGTFSPTYDKIANELETQMPQEYIDLMNKKIEKHLKK